MILIPVKGLETAKQRLAPLLDAAERSALAMAMLEDVLRTLAAWPGCPPVALVTGDARARRLARRFGFEVIVDRENVGETAAIDQATRACRARGAASALVIPADIPLIEAAELEAVAKALPASPGDPGTVLVPSADGRGTNAVLRRPPALFPLRFGDDSFKPHWRAARATGQPCAVLRLRGIGLDVDTPADLAALLDAESRTESQALLLSWSVQQRCERLARAGRRDGVRITTP